MRGIRKYMRVLALLALIGSLLPLRAAADEPNPFQENISVPLEEVTVCGSDTPDCRRLNCMELCLAEGEDPLDCPSYCILHTKNLSPGERDDLDLAIFKAKRPTTVQRLSQIFAD